MFGSTGFVIFYKYENIAAWSRFLLLHLSLLLPNTVLCSWYIPSEQLTININLPWYSVYCSDCFCSGSKLEFSNTSFIIFYIYAQNFAIWSRFFLLHFFIPSYHSAFCFCYFSLLVVLYISYIDDCVFKKCSKNECCLLYLISIVIVHPSLSYYCVFIFRQGI